MSQKPSGIRPPSSSKMPSSSGTKVTSKSNVTGSKKGGKDPAKSKPQEFQLPALSIPITGKKHEINFEELKKKMIRRNAPAGEDKKALAQIIKNLKCQKARVQEFVSLVAPYTGDNGDVMRKVLEDDLASFRRLVTKVYETMTQDVSDVLVNEQFQTSNYYSERCDMLNQKILKMVTDIYEMAPDFDFEKYHRDRQEHLNVVMPLPILIQRDDHEVEMQRRQEMFHRLQWLRFEGTRLSEENDRLHKRLNQLKRQQKNEQKKAAEAAALAEAQKLELEAEEAEKQEVLEELNESLGKSMVRTEAYTRMEEEVDIRQSMVPIVQQGPVKPKKGKRKPKPSWVSTTAKQLEESTVEESVAVEKGFVEGQRRSRRRSPHFSPIKTPPPKAQKPSSPFHYSPPKLAPEGFPQQNMEEVTIDETTTTMQQRRDGGGGAVGGGAGRGACPSGRRCGPPKDSWGGFQ